MLNRRLFWPWIAAGTVLAMALTALLTAYRATLGVQIDLANDGVTAVRGLVVHLTGQSCSLGDVPPGGSKSVRVNPTSESHVEIEFTDEQGQRIRLNAGGYFEPGYRGRIDIRAKDDTIEDVHGQPVPRIY